MDDDVAAATYSSFSGYYSMMPPWRRFADLGQVLEALLGGRIRGL